MSVPADVAAPSPVCARCLPAQKPARRYALREPIPDDCPLPAGLRFVTAPLAGGPYVMCDDCAREGARWFELKEAL